MNRRTPFFLLYLLSAAVLLSDCGTVRFLGRINLTTDIVRLQEAACAARSGSGLLAIDLNTQTWSTIDSPRLGPWHHAVGAIIGPNLHVVGGWGGDFLDAHETYQASHLLFLPIGAQGAKP